MTTYMQAIDDILTKFKTAWDTTGFEVIYPDVPLTAAQTALIEGTGDLEPWCRVTIRHGSRRQKTLGADPNSRIFDNNGIAFFEVYTTTGDGGVLAYQLSEVVRNAFEGISTPNGVWFRDCVAEETGLEGMWSRRNVTCAFEYDDRR
jgi:hypothetical protein